MILNAIQLGEGVDVHESSSVNNVRIGNRVKIAKYCSIFGSSEHPVVIGDGTYVGMHTIINGYRAGVTIGRNCSIAQGVNIMSDSGPNASLELQRVFPLVSAPVHIGDHTWIGANAVILPEAVLGRFCVVGAGALVKERFGDYSIVGGVPATLIRRMSDAEIGQLQSGQK